MRSKQSLLLIVYMAGLMWSIGTPVMSVWYINPTRKTHLSFYLVFWGFLAERQGSQRRFLRWSHLILQSFPPFHLQTLRNRPLSPGLIASALKSHGLV